MLVAIVLYKGMTTLDAIGPYEVLRFLPDVKLCFVSNKPGPVVTDSGVLVLGATHSFAEVASPDIVLVPGSEADTTTAMANEELIQWLQNVHRSTQWTLSVCTGALILAAAGILDGHKATTHWMAQEWLQTFGAIPQKEQRIVRSGKIVTAAGVSAGIDLALWLVGEIAGQERAEIAQLAIEYDPKPAYDSGHPDKASREVFQKARKEMLQRASNVRSLLAIPKIAWETVLQKIRKEFKL
ncbi:MAG: DJ-1/PfpI family protein [Spirochaetota bacterium]